MALFTPQEAFLYAKAITDAVSSHAQALLQSARNSEAPAQLQRCLKLLTGLHNDVQEFLCGQDEVEDSGAADLANASVEEMMSACRAVAKALGLGIVHQEPGLVVQQALDARTALVAQELAEIGTLLHGRSISSSIAAVCQAIALLRKTEADFAFQVKLAKEISEKQDALSYSNTNYAYGSTPYSSWLRVMDAVQAACSKDPIQPGQQYMVWGSSLGWLVIFGWLAFGWPSVGCELLACLVEEAQSTAQQLGASEGLKFYHADLLFSDLSTTGLLLCTDQCWDKQLMEKAAAKAARELPAGACVIDYTGSMQRMQPSVFTPLVQAEVPVSWHKAGHVLHACIKKL